MADSTICWIQNLFIKFFFFLPTELFEKIYNFFRVLQKETLIEIINSHIKSPTVKLKLNHTVMLHTGKCFLRPLFKKPFDSHSEHWWTLWWRVSLKGLEKIVQTREKKHFFSFSNSALKIQNYAFVSSADDKFTLDETGVLYSDGTRW